MTKIDDVARAICKSRTCEGIACCQWPSQAGRLTCAVRAGGYDDAALEAARAVVSVEPSTEEIEAAKVAAYHVMHGVELTRRARAKGGDPTLERCVESALLAARRVRLAQLEEKKK